MTFTCSICGGTHDELPDVAFHRPDAILELSEDARAKCFESDDGCVIPSDTGEHDHFLRGVLHIPIVTSSAGREQSGEETWGLGLWARVGREGFESVIHGEPGTFIEAFVGDLATEVPELGGPSAARVLVMPGRNMLRPTIVALESAHPLGRLGRDGITPQEVWAWFHATGLDAEE